jgi:hypothetical protein
VALAGREQSRERRKQRAIGWPQQGSSLLASEHHQLMAQHEQLNVFGALAAPTPHQEPQHSREGEIGERKEHAPMLSSPDAKGSKRERLGLGRQPLGCNAQHDLVRARAREPVNGASERRYQGRQSNHSTFARRTRILKPLTPAQWRTTRHRFRPLRGRRSRLTRRRRPAWGRAEVGLAKQTRAPDPGRACGRRPRHVLGPIALDNSCRSY